MILAVNIYKETNVYWARKYPFQLDSQQETDGIFTWNNWKEFDEKFVYKSVRQSYRKPTADGELLWG